MKQTMEKVFSNMKYKKMTMTVFKNGVNVYHNNLFVATIHFNENYREVITNEKINDVQFLKSFKVFDNEVMHLVLDKLCDELYH